MKKAMLQVFSGVIIGVITTEYAIWTTNTKKDSRSENYSNSSNCNVQTKDQKEKTVYKNGAQR